MIVWQSRKFLSCCFVPSLRNQMSLNFPRSNSTSQTFDRDRHVNFFKVALKGLPLPYSSQEVNQLTFAYFCVVALDLLGALDEIDKESVIQWVYSLQVLPSNDNDGSGDMRFGFRGSHSIGIPFQPKGYPLICSLDGGHLAQTYTALAILCTLGDDFSRVRKEDILKTLRNIQEKSPVGSFMPLAEGAESDLRFVFCAAVISSLLNDWGGVDKNLTKKFVLSCKNFDGGFGLNPGLESHGGATYCALACLKLLEVSKNELSEDTLLDWCVHRHVSLEGGFQGRGNKLADTCYGFWVGGCLEMIGKFPLIEKEALESFLLSCQSKLSGGFSKVPRSHPDILHSFYGVCAFSLLGVNGTQKINPEFGISERALLEMSRFRSC